ncbi:MAG TPA: Wzz/FepE/Etk N-terminal domain-containing protein [Anaerolineae bacterium]|nr:Wzz/FepE/Etk N-terminal domain-containing protein [Anaerolineae bacterium]
MPETSGAAETVEVDAWMLGSILWRRRGMLAIILGLFVVAGGVVALVRPRVYAAEAVMRVSEPSQSPVEAGDLQVMADYIARSRARPLLAHVQFIRSADNLSAALATLSPSQRAVFSDIPWQLPVTVRSEDGGGSNLISITVRSKNTAAAIALADAIADTYAASVDESNWETAQAVARVLRPELAATKDRLNLAQQTLTAARKRTGVYEFSIEYTNTLERLITVRASIADTQVELHESRATLEKAEEVGERAAKHQVKLAGLEVRLQSLEVERRRLEQRLEELNRIASEMQGMETEVNAMRLLRDTLEEKARQMTVNAASRLTAVEITSRAKEPLKPAGVPKRLLVLVSAAVGLVLGVSVVLVQEGADLRRRGVRAQT